MIILDIKYLPDVLNGLKIALEHHVGNINRGTDKCYWLKKIIIITNAIIELKQLDENIDSFSVPYEFIDCIINGLSLSVEREICKFRWNLDKYEYLEYGVEALKAIKTLVVMKTCGPDFPKDIDIIVVKA